MKKIISIFCAILLFASVVLWPVRVFAETPNLITNPSVEAEANGQPANWTPNSWGTNTPTFSYDTTGHTGNRSLSVNVANYTSGDAKWIAGQTGVTAGQTYTYTDFYKSNVTTELDIAYTNASGVMSFVYLRSVPASSTWQQTTSTFTVPAGMVSASIYHIIYSNGSLQTDDASLTAQDQSLPPTDPTPTPPTNPPAPATNLIANPSFETANGDDPLAWQHGSWGTNNAVFSYVSGDAHTGTRSSKVTISNYVSGDAKWAFTPLTNLVRGSQYKLSAWYKTNTQVRVVASYVDTAGATQYLTLPTPLSSANAATVWQQYGTTLDIPADAVSMTVYFLISSNGWLQTDDFSLVPYAPVGFNAPMISLTFDDGWSSIYTNGLPILQKYGFVSTQYLISGKLNTPDYMTTAMVKAFQASGSEIASHTVTHPDLTSLTSTRLTAQLKNSQTSLRQLFGAGVAQNFASPYGLYNATTLTAIKQYYQSHRSTDVGFNTKDNFNPYNILVQDVNTDTTPAEVAAWVAKAKADKSWLVLVYHPVINSTDPSDYAVTPSNLDAELANIKASGVEVKRVDQALAIIKSQL